MAGADLRRRRAHDDRAEGGSRRAGCCNGRRRRRAAVTASAAADEQHGRDRVNEESPPALSHAPNFRAEAEDVQYGAFRVPNPDTTDAALDERITDASEDGDE